MIEIALMMSTLKWISAQIHNLGETECHHRLSPDIKAMLPLFHEHHLPILVTQTNKLPVNRLQTLY